MRARIRAVLRRVDGTGFDKEYSCGPLSIHAQNRKVFRGDAQLKLNPTCYAILLLLVQRFPKHVTREEIERHLWQDDRPEEDVLRKHIYQLRNVVDKPFNQALITTLPKVGYALEVEA